MNFFPISLTRSIVMMAKFYTHSLWVEIGLVLVIRVISGLAEVRVLVKEGCHLSILMRHYIIPSFISTSVHLTWELNFKINFHRGPMTNSNDVHKRLLLDVLVKISMTQY